MILDDEMLTATPQPGLIVISGIFNGNISNGITVYVTSCGCINGNIICKDLIIAGKVTGNVQVENLKICATGKLYFREIHCDKLTIEEGGLLLENQYPVEHKSPQAQSNVNNPITKASDKQAISSPNELVHFNCSF